MGTVRRGPVLADGTTNDRRPVAGRRRLLLRCPDRRASRARRGPPVTASSRCRPTRPGSTASGTRTSRSSTRPVALGAVDGLVVVGKALRSDRLATVQQWGLPVVLVSEEPQSADDVVVLPGQRRRRPGRRRAPARARPHRDRVRRLPDAARHARAVRRLPRDARRARHRAAATPGSTRRPTTTSRAAPTRPRACSPPASPTTAVVAATDRNAIGFQRALRAAGLVLPRDQAVIGFDHADSGARVTPRLSTVDAHYDRVGETAVSLLLSRMRGEEVPGGEYRAPSTLVLRESCGCTEAAQSAPRRRPAPAAAAATRCCGRSPRPRSSARPASAARGAPGAAPRETWWHAVVEPIETAAERGTAARRRRR